MRHVPPSLVRILPVLALLATALPAQAQLGHPLFYCAQRIGGGLRDFSENAVAQLSSCETGRLHSGSAPSGCDPDSADWQNLIDDLAAQANADECGTKGNPEDQSATTFRALCPIESRYTGLFVTNTTGTVAGTPRDDLNALVQDLFVTEYPSCPRPATAIGNGALYECASKIEDATVAAVSEMYSCFISCEKGNLADSDACVNGTGVPTQDKLIECLSKEADSVADFVLARCTSDALVTSLGCPLGTSTREALVAALASRLQAYAQNLSFETFHSSCRTTVSTPPAELVPADATLLPSGTTTKVACGQTLDATFFGTDTTLRFDTDLDCSAATTATDGILVAKNNVTISGAGKTRQISGPSRKSLRVGAGIVIAEGVKRVTVTGFRRIQNFGIGVLAAGGNRKIKVEKTTLFRNLQAGVRSDSPKTKIVEVVADRNGIGFELSGNDSLIKLSQARASEPQSASAADPMSPGWGFRLSGTDTDLDGITVRCTQCTAETGQVGFVLEGSGQLVESSFSRSNLGDGVWVDGAANRFRNNSVKMNGGHGVVVNGTENSVNKNQSDENAGAGFVVSGEANTLVGNGAGSLTDNGNGQAGFVVLAPGSIFDTNDAEANIGGGFSLQAPAAVFKGNRADSNGGVGFAIESSGTTLDSNTAEKSSSNEWQVAAGNSDASGNRANGRTIAIPVDGGTFE